MYYICTVYAVSQPECMVDPSSLYTMALHVGQEKNGMSEMFIT